MGNQSPAVPRKRMRVGINYMWAYDKYGLYFGPHWRFGEMPREEWMNAWLKDFETNLRTWKSELRIDVVRIFLFCNVQTFGNVGPNGKWRMPSESDAGYAAFFKLYTDDFQKMLQACERVGVNIIPSLVDFGIGSPEVNEENRCAIVNDPSTRDRFFTQALVPLLKISNNDKLRPTIYAWEVMNEPSWLEGNLWPNPSGNLPIPITKRAEHWDLWEFLKHGVDLIDKYLFPSTVGHRYYDDLFRYPTGTIPQFHYYPRFYNEDPSPLPPYSSSSGLGKLRNAFVGEFAAGAQGGAWPGLGGRDSAGPRERVRERLLDLERLGYQLGMIWPDVTVVTRPGSDPKISSAAAEGIRDYWRHR